MNITGARSLGALGVKMAVGVVLGFFPTALYGQAHY